MSNDLDDHFVTINPSSGQRLGVYQYQCWQHVEEILQISQDASTQFRKIDIHTRIQILKSIAEILRKNNQPLGELITKETGKPIKEAKFEVLKAASAFDYYSINGAAMLDAEPILNGPSHLKILVAKRDLGTVLAIMPWNFPIWQLVRIFAPSVLIGNPVINKPSDLNPETAKAFVELISQVFEEFKAPKMLHNTFVDHETVSKMISDPRIRGITFTGSTSAARKVAAKGGAALKKVVLELGGSDPYLVFEDADLESAAEQVVKARLVNNGQSCVAGKRFIVQKSIYQKFKDLVFKKVGEYKIGDPTLEQTDLGPLASICFKERCLQQLSKLNLSKTDVTIEVIPTKSADIANKLELQTEKAFLQPRWVLLDQASLEVKEFLKTEEFFCPVFLVMTFDSLEQGIQLANDTVYGLGACVFSSNPQTIRECLDQIACGLIFINERVQSDPCMPFGGVKDSGFGRELSGYGLLEFVNLQTQAIRF